MSPKIPLFLAFLTVLALVLAGPLAAHADQLAFEIRGGQNTPFEFQGGQNSSFSVAAPDRHLEFTFTSTATTTTSSASVSASSSDNAYVYNVSYDGFSFDTCTLTHPDSSTIDSFSSDDPSIATIDANGDFNYVPDDSLPDISSVNDSGEVIPNGKVTFRASRGNLTKAVSCDFLKTLTNYSETIDDYASTTLAHELDREVSSRISGLSPSATTYDVYSSFDHNAHTYTRNTNHFLSDIDLTSIAVTHGSNPRYNGVLVAPDIVIQAAHFHPSAGERLYFVDENNNVASSTIHSSTDIGDDIEVVRLDSDLPSSIDTAKVFATSTYDTKLQDGALTKSNVEIPIVFRNQDMQIRIGRFDGFSDSSTSVDEPDTSEYSNWYKTPRVGDSGSPAYGIIDGELVLMHTWHTVTSGGNISSHIAEINTAIDNLGSSHSLTTVDLSSYPDF